MIMTAYALGFLFTGEPRNRLALLIEKRHPAWQAGRLNGLGGSKWSWNFDP